MGNKMNDIKKLRKIIPELDLALHINKSNLQKMEWYDLFVDFIEQMDSNLYNEACEYADKQEEQHKLILKSEYENDKH
tara:strand:- start:618 stop:851 length:234 start_codon:yes stop_codon:yes gene_type:complete